jgi:predicted DsbA family dithiol-disulfide isomerase
MTNRVVVLGGGTGGTLAPPTRVRKVVEVFADVGCPFTHAGLHRLNGYRQQQGKTEPILRVRAWPIELVNGTALDGPSLRPKIEALRADVAPDLFVGFDEDRFPATTLPAMAAEAAAYRQGLEVGERFSLAVRHALFEDGLDVSDEAVLRLICQSLGVSEPTEADRSAVREDFAEGALRGVSGSPHFFTPEGDFFCPSLDITYGHNGYEVSFDRAGFERFVTAAFG